jgi:hypothetical protein
MLRLFKRNAPTRANRANSGMPLDRMISSWLAYTKAENATAIVIGMPHQIPASVGEHGEVKFKRHLAEVRDLPVPIPDDEPTQALMASSRLKSVAGWRSVPIWIEHAGQLYPMHGPPIELHLALLSMIQERLVSLNASMDTPKPMRYVEYDSDDPTHRCFAEVELLLGEDNTVRIEVVRHLREPVSVRAVASVY